MNELKAKEFTKPILSTIYSIIGIFIVIIGAILAVLALIGSGLVGRAGGAVIFAVAVLIALPLFGIAQVITYFGKTAFYTESINDCLNSSMRNIKEDTKQISDRLKSMVMRDIKREAAPTSERTIDCPLCGSGIPVGQLQKGSNTCPSCQQTFEAE